MSGPAGKIRTVIVAGDGVAAWSAAAALARRVPGLSVTVVPVADAAPAMADLFGGTAPSIGDFHADIGMAEQDVVLRTGSGFRLGEAFEGWTGEGSRYVHAFGEAGVPIGSVPFAQLWARERGAPGSGIAAFDSYSPPAAMATAGRFVPAQLARGDLLKGHGHGLQLDLPAYRDYLRGYARHLGVGVATATLDGVLVAHERMEDLRLSDGSKVRADLYVDATNAEARLIGALDHAPRQDWGQWLACDSVVRATAAPIADSPAVERAVAMEAGWRMQAPLPARTEHALIYAQGQLGDRKAQRLLREATKAEAGTPIRFAPGRRARAWIGNVVAIGEAHTVLEPLEAAPLHLLHAQIDRLVASLPDRDFADVELAFYNRETAQEADRLRDFLLLHYVTARRPEPFWRRAAAMPLPAELAETLALFRERGRLPVRDGESFSRDSWLAVLFGQDVMPHRTDAVARAVDPMQAARIMEQFRQQLATSVAAVPTQTAFLTHLRTMRRA